MASDREYVRRRLGVLLRSHLTLVVLFLVAGCSTPSTGRIARRVAHDHAVAPADPATEEENDAITCRAPHKADPEPERSDAPVVETAPVPLGALELYVRGRSLERQGDEAAARDCYVRSLAAQEARLPASASLDFFARSRASPCSTLR